MPSKVVRRKTGGEEVNSDIHREHPMPMVDKTMDFSNWLAKKIEEGKIRAAFISGNLELEKNKKIVNATFSNHRLHDHLQNYIHEGTPTQFVSISFVDKEERFGRIETYESGDERGRLKTVKLAIDENDALTPFCSLGIHGGNVEKKLGNLKEGDLLGWLTRSQEDQESAIEDFNGRTQPWSNESSRFSEVISCMFIHYKDKDGDAHVLDLYLPVARKEDGTRGGVFWKITIHGNKETLSDMYSYFASKEFGSDRERLLPFADRVFGAFKSAVPGFAELEGEIFSEAVSKEKKAFLCICREVEV